MATISAQDGTTTTIDWYPMTAEEAIDASWGFYYVQPPPFPPIRVNGQWVPWEDVYGPESLIAVAVRSPETSSSTLTVESSFQSMAQSQYSGPSSQSTRAPQRKPRIGVKGEQGTFGICYKTYGTNGFSGPHPLTGLPFPLPTYVAIDGQSRTAQTRDQSIPEFNTIAANFSEVMQKKGGWKQSFVKVNDQWGATDIKKVSLGGNSIFNTVNFGLLMTHGSFGNSGSTGAEADGVTYTYVSLGSRNWVRLTDMDFGSPGTNGLRWMSILACNMLQIDALNSMTSNGKTPVNDNLHLLMGSASVAYANTSLGRLYASNLVANVEIPQAWFNMAHAAYHAAHRGITNGIVFRAMGNGNCEHDKFSFYNDPDPNQAGWMTDDLVFDPNNP